MPGTAEVTINGNQWSVSIANTTTELTTGLSGITSLAAGTGMLFVLPIRQVVTVNTNQMLFPIDIIFIKDNVILDIARNIEPGYLVEEATPIDMFLEVNAGEAGLVEVEDAVDVVITTIQEPGFDISQIIAFAIPLALLGFVFGTSGLFGGGGKGLKERGGSSEGSYYWEIVDIETGEIMQKGKPYTTGPRALAGARSYQRGRPGKDKEHLVVIRIYDNLNMDEWGKTIKPVMESGMHHGISTEIGKTPLQKEALDRLWPYTITEIHSDGDLTVSSAGKKYVVTTEGGVFVHYTAKEALERITGEQADWIYAKVGDTEMRGRPTPEGIEFEQVSPSYDQTDLDKAVEIITRKIKGTGEHSLHGEPRRRLVEEYGSWAVGRAEAICAEGDIKCVEREAKRLIETLRTRYGEAPMRYVTIADAGATVFHPGDTISTVALERENRRVRALGETEATYK